MASAIPLMTGPTTDGVAITGNSHYEPWVIASTLDGSVFQQWDLGGFGQLVVSLPSPRIVKQYAMTARNDTYTIHAPRRWTFSGSLDGVNWTVLDTRYDVPQWTQAERRTYNIPNYTAYKFYRYDVTASYSGTYLQWTRPELYTTELILGAPLDYGRSFVDHTGGANEVRFVIESTTTILDQSGAQYSFFQCGSCKAENATVLYGDSDLFQPDNFDFLPIIGADHYLFFRRYSDGGGVPPRASYREVTPSNWGTRIFRLVTREATGLATFDDVRAASHAGSPIVARTEIWNNSTELRAVIEYPVKTLNIGPTEQRWQVDTGIVAVPDLSTVHAPLIDSLRLAYVAFNAPQFADFIVEATTSVGGGNQVYHYSERVEYEAINTLLSIR